MNNAYDYVTKENFEKVKDVLEWGIRTQRRPNEIAQRMSDETDIPIIPAQSLVNDELINTMQWLKDGNKAKG